MTSLSTLPFSSLNFTADCVLAAQFEALRNETSATAAFTIDKEDVGDVPVLTLVALVRAGVPPSINLTGITDGNIVDWYLPQHRADPNVGSDAITAPEACRAEYCRALRWEGDPDLAGIGVSFFPGEPTSNFHTHFLYFLTFLLCLRILISRPLSFLSA